jgi:hypothetical protein
MPGITARAHYVRRPGNATLSSLLIAKHFDYKVVQLIENKRPAPVLIAKNKRFAEQTKFPFAEVGRLPNLGVIPHGNSQPRQAISRLIPSRPWEGEI